jgi:hypothetical protein
LLVLASDLPLEEELRRLDVGSLPLGSPGRPTALDRLVASALLRAAASDLPLYQPDEEEVRARLEALRARFEQRDDWERFLRALGVDEPTLHLTLRRRMVAERYLRRTLRSPEGTEAWQAELDRVLTELGERVRVRLIAPLASP